MAITAILVASKHEELAPQERREPPRRLARALPGPLLCPTMATN